MCDYLLWLEGEREMYGLNNEEEIEAIKDALMMGAKYKELYEKLLWEKNVLISCLCSNKTTVERHNNTVIGEDGERSQVTTYHVVVQALDNDDEAIWGREDGRLVDGYACLSTYSAVQYILTEMRKFEDENHIA